MSPVQIIKEVASLVHQQAQGKGIEVKVQYDNLIQQWISSDPLPLQQIFWLERLNHRRHFPNNLVAETLMKRFLSGLPRRVVWENQDGAFP